jgi:coenzyme F420 biosynthesis associated uncharacterized protein
VTLSGQIEGRLFSRIAGTYPLAETYHLDALTAEMGEITRRVSDLVPEATGLQLSGDPDTVILGRLDWVERNVASFTHMAEPARKLFEEKLVAAGRDPALASSLINREMTLILAFLSRRVLGQYELVLPSGEAGDTVAYVGPNILQMERQHQFRPAEFRFWVALHELTHRAQFQGVPWLRDHFGSLVDRLVETSHPEPGRWQRVLAEIGERRLAGRPIVDQRGIFGLFATPDQSEIVDQVQALMSLLEGHGHYVMDRVGADHLRSQVRMSRVLKGRRLDRRTAALFRLAGLEMKMEQYRQGERFVATVSKLAGWEAVSIAFSGVDALPTLTEISRPDAWLERVG